MHFRQYSIFPWKNEYWGHSFSLHFILGDAFIQSDFQSHTIDTATGSHSLSCSRTHRLGLWRDWTADPLIERIDGPANHWPTVTPFSRWAALFATFWAHGWTVKRWIMQQGWFERFMCMFWDIFFSLKPIVNVSWTVWWKEVMHSSQGNRMIDQGTSRDTKLMHVLQVIAGFT